jgi:hypothetical protein
MSGYFEALSADADGCGAATFSATVSSTSIFSSVLILLSAFLLVKQWPLSCNLRFAVIVGSRRRKLSNSAEKSNVLHACTYLKVSQNLCSSDISEEEKNLPPIIKRAQ